MKFVKKVLVILGIVVIVGLLVVCIAALFKRQNRFENEVKTPMISIEENGTEQESEQDDNVSYVTMPDYTQIFYLTKENNYIPLVNFEYSTYTLTYILGYNKEEILRQEINPGDPNVDVDLYSYFGKPGEYDVSIDVLTKTLDGIDGYPISYTAHVIIEE